jgi:predicted AAA+ superfamily ATPase
MYRRNIESTLETALQDTRVVLLNGARQTGKSTLAQKIAGERNGRYLTLDDEAVLAVARSDPSALLRAAPGLTVIDEVQRAPELFAAMKMEVDRHRTPGRFLLTGSANIFLLPRLSESLAGRMEILPLLPLSQDEMAGARSTFMEMMLSDTDWRIRRSDVDRVDICRRIIGGGFPEVVGRPAGERRSAWFKGYLSSLIQRDVRDLSSIEGLTDLPRLLGLLAARSSALMNMSELSRSVGIAHSTLRRYLSLLEAVFILQPLPAWSTNSGKRFVKSPKIHLIDSGLAAHLCGDTDPEPLSQSSKIGPLLETFVIQELRKQLGWSKQPATAFHFRSAAGREVDLVLELPGGAVSGVEIKAAAKVGKGDFAGLEALAEEAGKKFIRGVLLYFGDHVLPFGDALAAVPITELWAGR